MEGRFDALISVLDRNTPVLVQTHDFPDHDAVGAACGLSALLRIKGYLSLVTFGGMIQSISLGEMIERLEIPFVPFDAACANGRYQTVVVDGSPASGTVRTVAGELIGVIDHHPSRKKNKCPFIDVRTDTGSCSSIVWTYWRECGLEPDRTTATALLAGIQLDTDFLSRKVSETDLDAHRALYFLGNPKLAGDVVRTALSVAQLADIGRAFSDVTVQGTVLLAEVRGEYSSELLSVLADFLLRLQEVTFIAVLAAGGETFRISARTRDDELDAGYVLHKALKGIGTGGGHPHMAGGVIRAADYPGSDGFIRRIIESIDYNRRKNEADSQTD